MAPTSPSFHALPARKWLSEDAACARAAKVSSLS